MKPVDHHDHHDHPEGLAADLRRLAALERRRGALRALAGLGALAAVPLASRAASCVAIESETAGPYPADGTNGNSHGIINALTQTGIVRSDIRSSFGSMSGTAAGVPTTLKLTLVNVNASCADLSGYAIYVWHCSRDGVYSLYGATDQNWLRGVQETDSSGVATFTTIFPGCYSGRMPHIHIEVYRSPTTATSYTNKLKTTQLAFPTDVCTTIYTTATGYSSSETNFTQISFATDNVFSDGTSTEMATVSGNVTDGYTVSLQVGISV